MPHGRTNICKACDNTRIKAYEKANPLVRKRRYQSASFKEKAKLVAKRYAKKFPERMYIANTVCRAVKKGVLVRPSSCSICNEAVRIYAHHEDYSKPLEVVWMCQRCHRKRHVEIDNDPFHILYEENFKS